MNSTKILLIYPDFRDSNIFSDPGLPVGLGYVVRSLEVAEINYEIVDLNIDDKDYLIKRISEFAPQFLGMSMLSYRCKDAYELLNKIKYEFPKLHIIAGGPHVTANRETVLMECVAIDIGVVGEGEIAILEIVRGNAPSTIKGVLYRADGAIQFTGERDFILSLDHVPFPTYAGFKMQKYNNTMVIHSSRGCPQRCIFCGAPRILGRKWRSRSAQSMVEELTYWYERGYRKFNFTDSNFAVKRERVSHFCDTIIGSGLQISLNAEGIRADHVDKELLQQMRSAGFASLTFGAESGSDKVLRNLKKGEKREQIESAIASAVDLGFEVYLFFIIGSPGETADDIHQSFELARKYDVAGVWFFNLTPIPGTEYYDWAISMGYIDQLLTSYPEGNFGFGDTAITASDVMTKDQLTYYIKQARRVERQIGFRHVIFKFLKEYKLTKLSRDDGNLNAMTWWVTHPEMEWMIPILRLVFRSSRITLTYIRKFMASKQQTVS